MPNVSRPIRRPSNAARWAWLVLAALLAGCAGNDDRAAFESTLGQGPKGFNDRNLDAVCGLFADDVILIYPDSPETALPIRPSASPMPSLRSTRSWSTVTSPLCG